MTGESHTFLKSKTRIDRKRLSKLRYSTTFQPHFVKMEKSLVKHFCDKKERSFNFLSFEGKRINFGVSKPKLRWFEAMCTHRFRIIAKAQIKQGVQSSILKNY